MLIGCLGQAQVPVNDAIGFKPKTSTELNAISTKYLGDIYFDSTLDSHVYWNGTAFVSLGGAGGASDGNDFPTGITVSGGSLSINIPNQGNPTISLGTINLSEFNNDAGYLTTQTDDQTAAEVPLTGYAKATLSEAITATDNLNQALGKVERVLDDKPNIRDDSPLQDLGFWVGTKAEYDAIGTPDPNGIYYTTDETPANVATADNQITSGVTVVNYDVISGSGLLIDETNQTTNLSWQKIGNFFWFSFQVQVDYQAVNHTPASIHQGLIQLSGIPETPMVSTSVTGYAALTSGNSITNVIGIISGGSTNMTIRVEKIFSDTATAAAATDRNITITGSFITN